MDDPAPLEQALTVAAGGGGGLKVFVGSSTEGRRIAEVVVNSLEKEYLVNPWWKGMFDVSAPPLKVLEEQGQKNDLAVLVASGDDVLQHRGVSLSAMRDNVLYEYGLFSGTFGRHRTHLMIPDSNDFRVPSDILGVRCVRYADTNGPAVAIDDRDLSAACVQLQLDMLAGLQKEPPKERPGLRLLKFLAWARREFSGLSLLTDTKAHLEFLVRGAAGFIVDEVESFGLKSEFDKLLDQTTLAIDGFPHEAVAHLPSSVESVDFQSYIGGSELRDDVRLDYLGGPWGFCGSPEKYVFSAFSDWRKRREHFLEKSQSSRWGSRYDYFLYIFERIFQHEQPEADAAWWYLGVAETLSSILGAKDMIEEWSERWLSPVSDAFAAFENVLFDRLLAKEDRKLSEFVKLAASREPPRSWPLN